MLLMTFCFHPQMKSTLAWYGVDRATEQGLTLYTHIVYACMTIFQKVTIIYRLSAFSLRSVRHTGIDKSFVVFGSFHSILTNIHRRVNVNGECQGPE